MNTTLREALARRIDQANCPDLDVAQLIGHGETRLRRRQIAAVLGSAAVAAVVVVVFALAAALSGPVKRSDGPPVNSPSPSPTETPSASIRPLFYIDVDLDGDNQNGVIHYGDRAIESHTAFQQYDVTDDGFVYIIGGSDGVWFSDGGSPEQIGRLCDVVPDPGDNHRQDGAVITGASGSLVAWFTCPDPEFPTLVVYDTSSGREVASQPISVTCDPPLCWLSLGEVVGEHVYVTRHQYPPKEPMAEREKTRILRYDVTTGLLTTVTAQSYAEDIRSNPRGVVLGDTWQTATLPDDWWFFLARGTQLVAWFGDAATTAFDTGSHQAIQLHLPPGYRANGVVFTVFEWLDDDTVALTPEHNMESADIITCRLSEGSCRLAVKAAADGTVRIGTGHWLPG